MSITSLNYCEMSSVKSNDLIQQKTNETCQEFLAIKRQLEAERYSDTSQFYTAVAKLP